MNKPQQTFKQQLKQLVNLAEKQLGFAEEGEWQRVEELEQMRQKLTRECFTEPVAPESATLAKIGIEKLQGIENKLLTLTSSARGETSRQLQDIQKASKASTAYKQHK